MPILGGCQCGRTRYLIDLEALTDVALCHCAACRKTTGGTHVTWATVPLDRFRWEAEPPASYKSSDHGTRYFCPRCGAQLALFTTKAPTTIDITVTTLDEAGRFPPDRHIWTQSKLPWVSLDDGLPAEAQERI